LRPCAGGDVEQVDSRGASAFLLHAADGHELAIEVRERERARLEGRRRECSHVFSQPRLRDHGAI
jgi:hypothetical protein